ncbi:MAG: hypothetical protein AAFO87_07725 [Cyanobacteria bacterium J06607_6]
MRYLNLLLFLSLFSTACHMFSAPPAGQRWQAIGKTLPKMPSFGHLLQPKSYASKSSISLTNLNVSLFETATAFTVTSQTEIQDSPNGNRRFTSTYPVIQGLQNRDVQDQLNRAIKQEITTPNARRFSSLAEESFCIEESYDSTWQRHIDVGECLTQFAQGSVVSILCPGLSVHTVYPVVVSQAVTFNLKTGEVFELSDLFKPDLDYREALLQEGWKDLKRVMNISDSVKEKFFGLGVADLVFYLDPSCDSHKTVANHQTLIYQPTCITFPILYRSGPERAMRFEVLFDKVELSDRFRAALLSAPNK